MSRPVTWTTVPITGDYAAIFTDMPPGAVLFETDQVVTSDGVTVFGGRLQVPLDGAGKLATELPATDDPSLNVQGWVYHVRELWLGGRTFYMSVPIAAAGTGINMADVAPVADPSTGRLYIEGDSAYQVAVDNGFVGTESQWLASITVGGSLSDTTPLALGVAAAGTSVGASRADHVHPMPSATDVGADPAGTAATAVAAITPTGIGAIATSEKGVANGVATLDADSFIIESQLPLPPVTLTVLFDNKLT